MGHELTATDGLVLTGAKAWHGLGTIVENAPTPREALRIAKLDWEVVQQPLSRMLPSLGTTMYAQLTSHVANVRQDTQQVLGVVGKNWTPFQNRELSDFCEALHSQGQVRIETAGSIRGGEKVWFLLRGEEFNVRKADSVFPYILVSNGHDGGTSLRCTPTTVRVVCSNTLHMVIPRFGDEGQLKSMGNAAFVLRHTGKLKERVEEARRALELYGQRLEDNRDLMDTLGKVDMDSKGVQQFFLEMHQRHFGAVKDRPKTEKEQKARNKAMDAVAACVRRFEAEQKLAGATAWNAFNAYTGFIQHDYASKRKDPTVRAEAKLSNNLFGINAERTMETFRYALMLAN